MHRSLSLALASVLFALFASVAQAGDVVPLPHCRLVYTAAGTNPGPMVVGTGRKFDATMLSYQSQGGFNGPCGVPSNAIAILASIVAVRPAGPGYFSVWAHGQPEPTSGTALNFFLCEDPVGGPAYPPAPGRLAVIPIDSNGEFWVEAYWYGADLVVDVEGAILP